MSLLTKLTGKIRGIFGLGLIGSLTGMAVGALWAAAQYFLGTGLFPMLGDVVGLAIGGGLSGAAFGVGFGVVLATLESKQSLEQLPLWRMACSGGAVGALVPTVYMLATSGTFHFVYAPEIVLTVVGTGTILGALVSTTMVGLAKRAHRTELAGVDEVVALLE